MDSEIAKVLIIDDSDDDRNLGLRALRKCGMPITAQSTCDGVVGLELMDRSDSPPNLVFLDIKMPRVDGIEILRRVRQHPRLSKVPVVILSSSDEPSDVRRCIELGADGFLRKPVDYDEYLEIVGRAAVAHLRDDEALPWPQPLTTRIRSVAN